MHHAGYVPKRAVHHLSVLIAALKGAVCKTVGFSSRNPKAPAVAYCRIWPNERVKAAPLRRTAEAEPPCQEHAKGEEGGEQDQQGQAREDDPADECVCLFALRRDD